MKHWFVLLTRQPPSRRSPRCAANAQIAVEVTGVGVRIGEPAAAAARRAFIEREVRGGPECRTVTIQEDAPTGTRTVTRRQCD